LPPNRVVVHIQPHFDGKFLVMRTIHEIGLYNKILPLSML